MARRAPSFTHERLHSIEVDPADRTRHRSGRGRGGPPLRARHGDPQRRRHPARAAAGREAGRPGHAGRHPPVHRDPAGAGLHAGDEGRRLRPHRAAVLARRLGPGHAHRLCRHQGRHAGHGAHLGAGTGALRHHRQRRVARAGADRHVPRRHPRGRPQGRADRRQHPRQAAGAAGRRGACGALLLCRGGRFRHRSQVLYVRWHQRREPDL